MEVGFNEELSLFQLNDHPNPEKMFNENYPFFTGSSEYMKSHFKGYAKFVKKYLKTKRIGGFYASQFLSLARRYMRYRQASR